MSTPKMINQRQFHQIYSLQEYITQNDIMLSVMENGSSENQQITLLGPRLRELRKALGMSQTELSRAVNELLGDEEKKGTQSHISNLENSTGDKLPSVQVLWALARILDTNTDYLLGLTDDPRPLGKLDDQVVITVEDPEERKLIQEAAEALHRTPKEDKERLIDLIRRLAPKPPRIIGGE